MKISLKRRDFRRGIKTKIFINLQTLTVPKPQPYNKGELRRSQRNEGNAMWAVNNAFIYKKMNE